MKIKNEIEDRKYIKLSSIDKVTVLDNIYFTSIGRLFNNDYNFTVNNSFNGYILCICSKGSCFLQLENRKHQEFVKYDYFILKNDSKFTLSTINKSSYDLYFVYFNGIDSAKYLTTLSSISRQSTFDLIISCFNNILVILENNVTYSTVSYANKTINFILDTLQNEVVKNRYISLEENTFIKFQQYIKNNLNKKINMEDIVTELSISPTKLNTVVKLYTNSSPMKYVVERKMVYAANLLVTTDLKIKNIATLIGFDDQYHFSKVFKKYYNISPQKYRLNNILIYSTH